MTSRRHLVSLGLQAARRRAPLLLAAFLAADAAVAVAACSSTSPLAEAPDATTEGGNLPDSGKDAPLTPPDGGGKDGGGHCTPVKGPCDLVLQDCAPDKKGMKQECVVSGTTTTQCVPVQVSQQLGIGRACCSNNPTGNPCLPGLTCVGPPCVDGGPSTGRCSPACCKGDDQSCGKSDPEGISGACDVTLQSNNVELHDVCTYKERCKPFKQEPCKAGQACLVDKSGGGSCFDLFGNGKNNRESCTFANECADGLVCAGSGDAGICRTVCLLPNTVSPFDAAIEEAGPGKGGCPVNEGCRLSFTNSPAWFGACAYPDGG